jgi:two-component system, OmpR family, alkaline phosphatase synthesis response regulator PhoP
MTQRILVVDDEEDISFSLARRLSSEGFEVICAEDGAEGLRRAQTESPNLIVLDLMLPKMDGYKVCRLLKFDERYKRIPIIMLTARSQDEDAALGREMGADAYMTKPFDSGELLQKIQELLAAAAAAQAE